MVILFGFPEIVVPVESSSPNLKPLWKNMFKADEEEEPSNIKITLALKTHYQYNKKSQIVPTFLITLSFSHTQTTPPRTPHNQLIGHQLTPYITE